MRNSIFGSSLFAFVLCGAAQAQQVTVPNTFGAGAPARAAEVNANFEAVVTAINGLGARLAKLEGQITSADLVGTYTVHQFQTELGGGNTQRVAAYTSNAATVTLAAGGGGSLSSITELGSQLSLPGGTLSLRNRTDAASTVTWALANGRVTLLGDSFSVADGGRLLIRSSSNTADGTSVMLLLVRTN